MGNPRSKRAYHPGFDKSVMENMLDTIDAAICGGTLELNEWEDNFVDSIKEQIEKGKTRFTEAQYESLDKVYHKAIDPCGRSSSMDLDKAWDEGY